MSFTVSEMEAAIRSRLNEPTEALITSAEILRALNDGYKAVSRLAMSIENHDVVSTVSGDRLVPFDAHRVNFVYYGDADYVGGGGGKGIIDPGPGGGIGSDGWSENITAAYTYTENGTFVMSSDGYVEILIVGAGGPGGNISGSAINASGAGGGGGVIYEASHWLAAGSYPIVVGKDQAGESGISSFDGLIALKGGKGGGYLPGYSWNAFPGGSGGGGKCPRVQGLVSPGGAGEPGQGNDGADGSGVYGGSWSGGWSGGGGGASAPGSEKDGGQGYACSISGSSVVYGSGGAGVEMIAYLTYSNGTPGTNGGAPNQDGVDGTGGGGGCAPYNGAPTTHGQGGSGIVIIRAAI